LSGSPKPGYSTREREKRNTVTVKDRKKKVNNVQLLEHKGKSPTRGKASARRIWGLDGSGGRTGKKEKRNQKKMGSEQAISTSEDRL